MGISLQIIWLFILALPIACISWTITNEEIFREVHEYCVRCSKEKKSLAARKFFYLLTCEYCFSHYVTIAFLFLTHYHLLLNNWTGYIIAGFSLVWIANIYMNLYALMRQAIKKEKTTIKVLEKETDNSD